MGLLFHAWHWMVVERLEENDIQKWEINNVIPEMGIVQYQSTTD